jgi:hypothetical protein
MNISRQTVVNILKAAGLDPDPRHRPGVWDDFLHKHAETLWQCDFFSKRILSSPYTTHLRTLARERKAVNH